MLSYDTQGVEFSPELKTSNVLAFITSHYQIPDKKKDKSGHPNPFFLISGIDTDAIGSTPLF